MREAIGQKPSNTNDRCGVTAYVFTDYFRMQHIRLSSSAVIDKYAVKYLPFLAIIPVTSHAIINGDSSGELYDTVSRHVVAIQSSYTKPDGRTGYRKGTAVLVSQNLLLTAGHNAHRSEISSIQAIFSEKPCWKENVCGEERREVVERIFHPAYYDPGEQGVSGPPQNDLALLRLAEDAPRGYLPVPILERNEVTKRRIVQAGYGMSEEIDHDTPLEDFRLRAFLNFSAPNAALGSHEQFAIDQTLGGGCAGDSGGPALVSTSTGYRIAGIFSRVGKIKNEMRCLTVGIFTDVLFYRNWIGSHLSR